MKWPGAADAVNSRCGTAAAAAQGAGVAPAATAAAARPLLGGLLHADLVAAAAFTAVRWNRAASHAPALALGGAMARRLSRSRGRGPRQNDTRVVVLMDRGRGRGAARHPTAAAASRDAALALCSGQCRGAAGCGVVVQGERGGAGAHGPSSRTARGPAGRRHRARRHGPPWLACRLHRLQALVCAHFAHAHVCRTSPAASQSLHRVMPRLCRRVPAFRAHQLDHLQLSQPVQGVCYTAEISNRKWVGNQVRGAQG